MLKILYFISMSVKRIFWQIVENQDLYRDKDDFGNLYTDKKFLYFNFQNFIFRK